MIEPTIQIEIDPCFLALTRPATLLGVTSDFWLLNIMISGTLGICSTILYAPIACFVIHVAGMLAYKIDPFIFRLWEGNLLCAKSPNKRFWSCITYEPW